MTLLRMESCEQGYGSLGGSKWTSATGLERRTTGGKVCWGVRDGADLRLNFSSDESATVIVGFSFYGGVFSSTNLPHLNLYSDDGSTLQAYLKSPSASTDWGLYRGDGTLLSGFTNANSPVDTWRYVELKYTCNDSTGAWEFRVDGISLGSATSVDTRNGGTDALIDAVRFSAVNASGTANRWYVRDIVIMNDTGSAFNDLIGPVRVEAVLPDADGNYSAWTVNSGSTHYVALDEDNANDGDTTYVEATSTGLRDSYSFANTTLPTVDAVQASAEVRYDVSPLSVATFLRRSATDDDGTAETPTGSYGAYGVTIWETDPIAAGAWTLSNFNATEFGLLSST